MMWWSPDDGDGCLDDATPGDGGAIYFPVDSPWSSGLLDDCLICLMMEHLHLMMT